MIKISQIILYPKTSYIVKGAYMDERKELDLNEVPDDEYSILESRLYGELMRSCQKYMSKIRIISILGVLDFVRQDVINLEKKNRELMNSQLPNEFEKITLDE